MNWTGGRLRRQSHNRPDSLSRIQKQHFAKARIRKQEYNNKATAIPHLRSISHTRGYGITESSQLNQDSLYSAKSIEIQSRLQAEVIVPNISLGPSSQPLLNQKRDDLSYIDTIKQHLLHKKDWVGISPTRPVRVDFVPIEEKERIGKRRSLADRSKITTTTGRSMFHNKSTSYFDGSRYYRQKPDEESSIEIRFYTPENPKNTSEFMQSIQKSNSSGSMLLDDDTHDGIEEHSVVNIGCTSYSDTKQGLSPPDFLPRNNKTQPSSDLLTDDSMKLPVLHRFTLDDQILAEQERNSGMKQYPSNEIPPSPRHPQEKRFLRRFYHESEEQLGLPVSNKNDNRFSEGTGSCRSNSDLLPQTQKITRHLPPPQQVPKQSVPSALFQLNQHGYKGICSKLVTHNDLGLTFFGQVVPTPSGPNGVIPNYHERSSSLHPPSLRQHQDNHPGILPPGNTIEQYRIENDKLKSPNRFTEEVPSFRFSTRWTPHRYEHLMHTEERNLTNIPTSPFVVAISASSSLFGGSNKAFSAFDTGLISTPISSNKGEDRDVAPYFNTPFRR